QCDVEGWTRTKTVEHPVDVIHEFRRARRDLPPLFTPEEIELAVSLHGEHLLAWHRGPEYKAWRRKVDEDLFAPDAPTGVLSGGGTGTPARAPADGTGGGDEATKNPVDLPPPPVPESRPVTEDEIPRIIRKR